MLHLLSEVDRQVHLLRFQKHQKEVVFLLEAEAGAEAGAEALFYLEAEAGPEAGAEALFYLEAEAEAEAGAEAASVLLTYFH